MGSVNQNVAKEKEILNKIANEELKKIKSLVYHKKPINLVIRKLYLNENDRIEDKIIQLGGNEENKNEFCVIEVPDESSVFPKSNKRKLLIRKTVLFEDEEIYIRNRIYDRTKEDQEFNVKENLDERKQDTVLFKKCWSDIQMI